MYIVVCRAKNKYNIFNMNYLFVRSSFCFMTTCTSKARAYANSYVNLTDHNIIRLRRPTVLSQVESRQAAHRVDSTIVQFEMIKLTFGLYYTVPAIFVYLTS